MAFGSMTDTTQNGKMPGGIAVDATDPTGEHVTLAGKVDPRGTIDPRTSPTPWIMGGVIVFVYLNARARRRARKG